MEAVNDNEDLKSTAPFLAGLPKADPFVVPDGFFDRFPHQVQAAITAPRSSAAPAWAWWKRLSIALPIIALSGLAAWMLAPGSDQVELPAVAVTPLTDGELDAIDDNEIFAAFDEADANDITAEDLGEVDLELSDDELLAYLDNEDADITDLITDIE
ncbi:MAG: hypothetical protein KA791_01560 [Flavobacteriales bacterium]|jgi:hypothetical protein|nr:hypothetical protein [Flavobacteriales bacterium]